LKPARARSGQVDSPARKERAQDQLLEQDLIAKVVSSFVRDALILAVMMHAGIRRQRLAWSGRVRLGGFPGAN
jgi:hypothetical protein